jgi:hypothetical protein
MPQGASNMTLNKKLTNLIRERTIQESRSDLSGLSVQFSDGSVLLVKGKGTGNIDWTRLLIELDRTGFRGGFILELASVNDAQHLLAEARKSKRFLRDIDRRLALSHPAAARADLNN